MLHNCFKNTIKEFISSGISFLRKLRSLLGYFIIQFFNKVVSMKESGIRYS